MVGMKSWKILLFVSLCICLGEVRGQGEIITSPPFTDWGQWGPFDKCPNGTYAQGFQLKTEPYRGALVDDTAGNGIKLFCGQPLESSTPTVTSTEGGWGSWGNVYTCGPDGYIYGFQLRVEHNGIDDETATNNIRVFCTNEEPHLYLEGDGLGFGRWTEERKCAATQALCGIQTQVQRDQGFIIDDTSLNNIAAECCDIVKPTTAPPTTTPTTTTPTTTTPTTTTPTTTPTTTTPTTTTPTTTTPTTTTPTTTTPTTTTPTTTTPTTTTPTTTTPTTTTPTTTTPTTTTPTTTTPTTTTPTTTTPTTTTPTTTTPTTTTPTTTTPTTTTPTTTTPTTTTPTTTTPTTTTPTTTTPTPTNSTTTEFSSTFECPFPEGNFADPENCAAYYQCEENYPHHQYCPSGLYFNPTLQVCDFPQNVQCEIDF